MKRTLLLLVIFALGSLAVAQFKGSWQGVRDWDVPIGSEQLTENGFNLNVEPDWPLATLLVVGPGNSGLCDKKQASWTVRVERLDSTDWPSELELTMRDPSGRLVALGNGTEISGEGCGTFDFGYRLTAGNAMLPVGTYTSDISLEFRSGD